MLSTIIEIERLLASGLRLHQAGHLAEAERVYRQILSERPDHANALHFLGVLAHQVGQYGVAAEHIGRSVALVPNNARAHSNLGAAHRDNGQPELAAAACRQALALDPNLPEAHSNLGNALKDAGQLDDAIVAYRRAVALMPTYADAHYNLGTALAAAGKLDEAVTAFRQAIALRPSHAEALNNLGNALKELGQTDDAVAAYRRALALRPDYPEAHSNLGKTWKEMGKPNEAIWAYRQAIALRPDFAEAYNNLGNALQDIGNVDEAVAVCRQAIALRPNFADAHNNLGLALLLRGDFREGWDEHEWRRQCQDFLLPRRSFSQAPWNGDALGGRTLLLHAEQGFGDTIQFIRYAPPAAQRGAKLVIECQDELVRLVQSMALDLQVVARGQPLPPFDAHCSLLSLPRIFATDLTNIPRNAPYLHAKIEAVEQWRIRLAGLGTAPRVGLVWAGQPAHKNDHNRSMRLADFAPLTEISGVSFFSLQKGAAAAQVKDQDLKFDLFDLTADLNDFSDTAGLIANLDLVIGVDTAVVHLAGAMGKPVWTLLPFAPDWRWLRGRDDSPWYPTMRLFRQPSRGDWGSVTRRVAEALHHLSQNK